MEKEEGQKLCHLEKLKGESIKGGVREAEWKRNKRHAFVKLDANVPSGKQEM